MDGLRISKILANLRNPELYLIKLRQDSQNGESTIFSNNNLQQNANQGLNNLQNNFSQNFLNNSLNQNSVTNQNNNQNSQQPLNNQQNTNNTQQNMHNLWGPKNDSQAQQSNTAIQNNNQNAAKNNSNIGQNNITQQSANNQQLQMGNNISNQTVNNTQQSQLQNQNLTQNINQQIQLQNPNLAQNINQPQLQQMQTLAQNVNQQQKLQNQNLTKNINQQQQLQNSSLIQNVNQQSQSQNQNSAQNVNQHPQLQNQNANHQSQLTNQSLIQNMQKQPIEMTQQVSNNANNLNAIKALSQDTQSSQDIQKNIVQNAIKNLDKNTPKDIASNDISKNITSYIANKQSEVNQINKEIPKFNNDNIIRSDTTNTKTDVPTNTNSQQNAKQITIQPHASQLASMDRSVYIKNLLGLPQTLGEILLAAQNKSEPISLNTLTLNNLNQDLLQNQKMLSQIFDEKPEIPLNIDLNINPQILQQTTQASQAMQRDVVMLFFSGMIHMPAISELILKNSKQAVSHLIIAMASASKNGMTAEEIRDTLNVINTCVSMAESGNPVQTLKSLMMLYLPWLPLNEGVGFDLEVDPPDGENKSIDSKLTVLVQTRNFGNVKGVFTLTTSNSVDVYIICSEDFPKRLLQKSLLEEGSSHAMNTTIDIDSVIPINKNSNKNQEAKVNLSATNEMNPYLLLMAHAFIRNTIYIDSNGIIEDYPNVS